jgi:hypothetical protein
MVDGPASNLYASDTDTWLATSMIWSSGKELVVDSRSPSDPVHARSHLSLVKSR